MKRNSVLGLGTVLGALIGLLGVSLVVLSAVEVSNRYADWRTAQKVEALTVVDRELFNALQAYRFEQANTLAALSQSSDKTADTIRQIGENRSAVDKAFGTILAAAALDVPKWADAYQALSAASGKIKTLREAADKNLPLPLRDRNIEFVQGFEAASGPILDAVNGGTVALEDEIQTSDPSAGKLISAKTIAWRARISAGDISQFMVRAASQGGFVSPDDGKILTTQHTQLELAWAVFRDAIRSIPDNAGIMHEIDAIDADYFHSPQSADRSKEIDTLTGGGTITMSVTDLQAREMPAVGRFGGAAATLMEAALGRAQAGADAAQAAMIAHMGLLVGAVLLGIIAFLVVLLRVVRPIRAMTGCMIRLAGGETGIAIPAAGRADEIGGMAAAVEVFKSNLIRTQVLEQEGAALRLRVEEERKVTMNQLALEFERSVGGIVSTVSSTAQDLEDAARSLSAAAEETSSQSTAVAAAAEEAGSNVANVASAAEEVGSSIREIARQVEDAAAKSEGVMAESVATAEMVQDLSGAAAKIGNILAIISAIAEQTNLLALNATIEAARAGEAGRGFAVVAAEVKTLANQTAKATADISTQIAAIQSSTERAANAVTSIAGSIETVNQMTRAMSLATEQQGIATQEIVANIHEASKGTLEVTSNITGVARAANETGRASNQVLQSSSELARQASALKAEMARFLGHVRVA